MKKYEIDYRKMYMSSEDFMEMFKFSLQKLLSLIFEKDIKIDRNLKVKTYLEPDEYRNLLINKIFK